MGHENDRDVDVVPDLQQVVLHLGAGLRIQCAEGFVHQQHPRLGRKGAGDRDTLLHAAGKLAGVVVRIFFQTDDVQPLQRHVFGAVAADAAHFQREHDVLLDRQPREQGVFLKHHSALRARFRDRFAVQQDFSGSRGFKPGQNPDQRRFAAAGGTDDRKKFAVMQPETDILQDRPGAVRGGELLAYADSLHDYRTPLQPDETVEQLGSHLLVVGQWFHDYSSTFSGECFFRVKLNTWSRGPKTSAKIR